MITRRDDTGVIAIVVALSISTFLLGFAALAVDLGSAYTRKAELRSIADRLTLAGARGLPSIPAALTEIDHALAEVCRDEATPGVCRLDQGSAEAPDIGWATDGQIANGEVSFFVDPDGDGRYRSADRVSPDGGAEATALQVRLARSTVPFGLASALGVDSATLTRSATGRIGTPLGAGLLPFALTPADLAHGQFCVSDAEAGSGSGPGTGSDLGTGSGTGSGSNPGTGTGSNPGDGTSPGTGAGSNPEAGAGSGSNPEAGAGSDPGSGSNPNPGSGSDPEPGSGSGSGTGTGTGSDPNPGSGSGSDPQDPPADHPSPDPPAGPGLCEQAEARRGFVQLARSDGPGGLAANIRTGPEVRLYPAAGAGGAVGNAPTCAADSFAPATSCLLINHGSFGTALTAGFLDPGARPGRLLGNCGNGTTMSHSRTGVDDSHLFTDPGFITVDGHFSRSELRSRITAGVAAGPQDRGWLTSKVLTCPRLAVMPVITTGAGDRQEITGFRYVWIDDETDVGHRGLNGDGSQVTGFRGYVVDPGYLPAVVSGSAAVGPFLGGDMPVEALLITDLTD